MLHTLRAKQFIKSDLDTVWRFMSSPANLSKITPAYMGFEILSEAKDIESMYQGQIIEYYVKPVLGINMHWVTEITHVADKQFFVDEQRFGPYALWHHKHILREVPGGIEMEDLLHYKLPFGFLGRLVNRFYVRRKVQEIFDYRYKVVEEMFN